VLTPPPLKVVASSKESSTRFTKTAGPGALLQACGDRIECQHFVIALVSGGKQAYKTKGFGSNQRACFQLNRLHSNVNRFVNACSQAFTLGFRPFIAARPKRFAVS
jgi:hypothetical protein